MSEKKTPQGVLVRKVQFAFPEDFKPYWNSDKPIFSQMANGASLFLPYMEPFIIHSVREATKHIEDPALLEEARAWMAQEAHHFKQHRRFNEALIACGYPELREQEEQIERGYAKRRKRSLKYMVAYTAGFEVMALAIAHSLLEDREYFFKDADPSTASLWMWHLIEEIEHKNLAFDIYQHLYGGHLYRAYGILAALIHMMGMIRPTYVALLKKDGLWGRGRRAGRSRRSCFGSFGRFYPARSSPRFRGTTPRRSKIPHSCGNGSRSTTAENRGCCV